MILGSGQATVPASGTTTVTIAVPRNEYWTVTGLSVLSSQATTVTTMPTATVYLNSVNPTTVLASTYTGARDTATGSEEIQGGSSIICQWVGGVVGSVVSLTVTGTRAVSS